MSGQPQLFVLCPAVILFAYTFHHMSIKQAFLKLCNPSHLQWILFELNPNILDIG